MRFGTNVHHIKTIYLVFLPSLEFRKLQEPAMRNAPGLQHGSSLEAYCLPKHAEQVITISNPLGLMLNHWKN